MKKTTIEIDKIQVKKNCCIFDLISFVFVLDNNKIEVITIIMRMNNVLRVKWICYVCQQSYIGFINYIFVKWIQIF